MKVVRMMSEGEGSEGGETSEGGEGGEGYSANIPDDVVDC